MKINVKVFPKSGREEILKIKKDLYKVYLKKPAIDNKANTELLKLFKKTFKKPVRIIKGLNSRDKVVEIIE